MSRNLNSIMQGTVYNTAVTTTGAEGAAEEPARVYTRWEPYRPKLVELMAKRAYAAVGDEGKRAYKADMVAAFKQEHPEIADLNVSYFYDDTVKRLHKGTLKDQWGPGPAKKLSDAAAEYALKLFLEGLKTPDGQFYGYTSVHHAIHERPELLKVMDDAGVKPHTLHEGMERAHRRLYGQRMHKISLRWNHPLGPEVKAERLEAAKVWLEWGEEKLRYVVWIDEKSEWLTEQGIYRCYAPLDMESHQVEGSKPLGKSKKVAYIAAVSGWAGPLYLNFTSGTTGIPEDYTVRTCVPPGADLDPPASVACAPGCVND